jgi:hypothetical protein
VTHVVQKSSPKRRGFSLVLSLTIMAMILLMVITLASFLSIEARLAAANQLRTQARMQALVSLRLALAHLQQEAGPDRRATFRADMYRLAYSNPSTRPSVPEIWSKARNPMWTGVQRTDRPFQLPSWIVSGRGDTQAGTQMLSLARPPMASPQFHPFEFTPIAYPSNYWIPWETSYTGGNDTSKITLVGDATGVAAEDENSNPLSGRPDGRVSLPAVTLPDSNVSGRYCYWVGDEGVKANIALVDPRVQTSATNSSITVARRGVGRTGVELLTGFSNYQVGDIDSRIRSTDQLKLLSSSVFSDSTGNNARALWPDVTLVSQGLFTDNRWGGLQIDLSTVFEKSDPYFEASEFGQGDGSVEQPTAPASDRGLITYAFEEGKQGSSSSRDWQAFKRWKKPIMFNGRTDNYAPVWTLLNRPGEGAAQGSAKDYDTTSASLRGPTWSALRDYHLLYQQLSSGIVGGLQLTARTHFPNASAFATSSYPGGIGFLHYSQMYNRSITPRVTFDGTSITYPTGNTSNNFFDFKGYDRIYYNGPRGNSYNTLIANNNIIGSFLGPIPTKVSVAPTITRQLVAIGMIKDAGIVNLVISPITVLHNPYNVRLSVGAQRISIRDMDNWWVEFTRNYTPGLENSIDTFNGIIPATIPPFTPQSQRKWRNDLGILSAIKQNNPGANKFQSLRFDIPATTIEPGEFKIYTASSLSTNYSGTLTNSFNTNTGFYGPCLEEYKTALPPTTAVPLRITRSDTASLFIQLWTSSYMPEGFKVVHQMVSWPGDNLPSGDATNESFYNTCSIVTEMAASPGRLSPFGISDKIIGPEPAPRQILNSTMPISGEQPLLLGVFDYSIRWPNDPSPFTLYARTNPLAPSRRVDANDTTWYHISDKGTSTTPPPLDFMHPGPYFFGTEYYSNTSPSFKFEVRDITSLSFPSVVVQTSGANAYGGMSNWGPPSNSGQTRAVYTEVPLSAPLSIAQYTHANFGLYDHDPLYIIGNSFHPAFSQNNLTYARGAGSGAMLLVSSNPPTQENESSSIDVSNIINRALFDRYFLSGISPVYSGGIITKNQASVIDDFIDGVSPLANPRIKLVSIDKETARTELKDQAKNHRKVAKHVVNEGAFNIHSMSVRAWAAVLAGAKAKALNNETGDSSTNARFPRAVRTDTVSASGVNQAPYTSSAAWTGLTNLTDDQIRYLAREIVRENMWRMSYYHRDDRLPLLGSSAIGHGAHMNSSSTSPGVTIRDIPNVIWQDMPAAKLPCPYLGLSQFINRQLCDSTAGGIRGRSGALQSAIVATDRLGGNLMNRGGNISTSSPSLPNTQLNLAGTTYSASRPPPPLVRDGNAPGMRRTLISLSFDATTPTLTPTPNYADVKLGAPTSLLQSDILAAIGNSLTVRSDTFTIRAYGDVSDKAGGPAAGTCWIEAVVQRLPEFMDTSQESDTMVSSTVNGLGHNANLLPVNINLGRRFVIISTRILKPSEL